MYITGVCLFPPNRNPIAVLTRATAIRIVQASGAVDVGCFAFIHLESGLRDTTGLRESDSIPNGLFFGIATFTTLGFGDLQPFPQGRLAAAFQAFSGYVNLGLGIGVAVIGFRTTFGDDEGQNADK